MKRIVLIHFESEEVPERIDRLRREGHDVEYVDTKDFRSFRGIRDNPPDAIVIDLARRPSHGREVGVALRQYKTTRNVPLVYVEGRPDKTSVIRTAIPDAILTTWDTIAHDLQHLQAPTTAAPVVGSIAAYSNTPLPKKLGVKEGSRIMTIAAPETFEATLGALPAGAEFVDAGKPDVLITFVTTKVELELRFGKAMSRAGDGTRLWVAWPKKTSGVQSDLSETVVRDFGLEMGWVDYKVCAIDTTWSGLLFSPKKNAGARRLRQAAR